MCHLWVAIALVVFTCDLRGRLGMDETKGQDGYLQPSVECTPHPSPSPSPPGLDGWVGERPISVDAN